MNSPSPGTFFWLLPSSINQTGGVGWQKIAQCGLSHHIKQPPRRRFLQDIYNVPPRVPKSDPRRRKSDCCLFLFQQSNKDKPQCPTVAVSASQVEIDPSFRITPTAPISYRSLMAKCNVRGCHGHTVYEFTGGIKIRSFFCQEHTCQGPRNALDGFCDTQRNPCNKCCLYHGKCRVTGCVIQAPRSISNQDLPWTCPPRKCIIITFAIQCRKFVLV